MTAAKKKTKSKKRKSVPTPEILEAVEVQPITRDAFDTLMTLFIGMQSAMINANDAVIQSNNRLELLRLQLANHEENLNSYQQDMTRWINMMLTRCDAHDKAIGKLEVAAGTLATRSIDHGRQMQRMTTLMGLIFRSQERFFKDHIETALTKSIRADLKTPTIVGFPECAMISYHRPGVQCGLCGVTP